MNRNNLISALCDILPAYLYNLCEQGATIQDMTSTFSKLDPTGVSIRSVLLSLVKTPTGSRPKALELARFFVALDGMSEDKRAVSWRKRFPDDPMFLSLLRPPRNVGGRPRKTADMARFWAEHKKLTYAQRAFEWMKRFPDDPRTKRLKLLEVQERLREAERRERRRVARACSK